MRVSLRRRRERRRHAEPGAQQGQQPDAALTSLSCAEKWQ